LFPVVSVAAGGLGNVVANFASCQEAVLLKAGDGAAADAAGAAVE